MLIVAQKQEESILGTSLGHYHSFPPSFCLLMAEALFSPSIFQAGPMSWSYLHATLTATEGYGAPEIVRGKSGGLAATVVNVVYCYY